MNDKKNVLLVLWLWYILTIIFLGPWIITYFFEKATVLSELLSLILSIGLPTCCAVLKKNKEGELLFDVGIKPTNFQRGDVLLVLLGTIALFCGLSYLQNSIQIVRILVTGDYSTVYIYPKADLVSLAISIFTYAVVPAVFEELLFRGLYADAFSEDKKWIKISIPVLSFAVMHSMGMGMLSAVIVGLFSMYCYLRFRTILLCVMLHFVFNLLGVLFTNVLSLPFSVIAVLNDYANDKQLMASVVTSIGIVGISAAIIVMCMIKLHGKKLQVSVQESSVRVERSKGNIIYMFLFLIFAVGTILIKIV